MKKLPVIIILLVLYSNISEAGTSANDTIRHKKPKNFIGFKIGYIPFFIGKSTDKGNDDHLKTKNSKSISFGYTRRIKNFSIGVNIDYTRFILKGNDKVVGHTTYYYTGTTVNYFYLINQTLQFSALSPGLSVMYSVNFKKIYLEFGPSAHFFYYKSLLKFSNHYVGEQNDYGLPLPQDNLTLTDADNYYFNGNAKPFMDYYGIGLNLGYNINKYLSVKFENSLFFCGSFHLFGNSYGYGLPAQSIYSAQRLTWINSGLSIQFNF